MDEAARVVRDYMSSWRPDVDPDSFPLADDYKFVGALMCLHGAAACRAGTRRFAPSAYAVPLDVEAQFATGEWVVTVANWRPGGADAIVRVRILIRVVDGLIAEEWWAYDPWEMGASQALAAAAWTRSIVEPLGGSGYIPTRADE